MAKKKIKTSICPICGELKHKTWKTCGSKECYLLYKNNFGNADAYFKKYRIELDCYKGIRTYGVIQWYKWTISDTPNGKRLVNIPSELINKEDLKILFKYVLEQIIGFKTRDDLLKLTQILLFKHKISFSRTDFILGSPLAILNIAYPEHDIKGFELIHAPKNYWRIKSNFDEAVIYYYKELKQKTGKYIISNFDIRNNSVGFHNIIRYTSDFYDTKDLAIVIQELTKEKVDILSSINNEGIKFDSIEERVVFDYIKNDLGISDIEKFLEKKHKRKFINNDGGRFIPDFIIERKDKIILIEYYGMYNENNTNKIFVEYREKCKRKNIFYNSLNDIIFIPIYPIDLKNGMGGIGKKLKDIV